MNFTSNQTLSLSTALYLRKGFLWINLNLLPLILFSGVVGNIASIVVCLGSKLNRISSNLYLATVAFYDSIVLLLITFNWLERYDLSLFNTSIGCPLLGYLLNVCTNLSAWCITAFTVERFVVVYYPLQRASICTHKQTRRVLVALLPYPLLINIYTLVTLRLQPHDGRCETSPSFARVHQLLGLLDTSVCFGLPVVTICVLNTLIALKVWAYSRQAEVLWAGQRGPHSAVETMAKERSITRVLLVVSGTFALLNLPAYIIRSKAQLVVALGRLDLWTDWDESLEQMAYFLYYSNFAINFLLYCMSSRNFRTAARRTFLPCTQARKSLQVTLSQSRSGRSTISQTMPLTSIN